MVSSNGRFNSFLGRVYGDDPATPPVEPPATFTQEQVNAMMNKHKQGLQKQLDDLKKNSGNAEALAAKLKEMNDQLLTKEELAKQEQDALRTTYEEQLKGASGAAQAWEGRYKETVFSVELSKAATKHDAFDPEQLGALLQSKSQVVEATDKDGKGLGQFKVMTKVTLDGKELVLPIDEAIGKLRESGRYPNQFKVKGAPGTGTTLNNHPGGSGDATELSPTDVGGFMKHFAKLKAEGKLGF